MKTKLQKFLPYLMLSSMLPLNSISSIEIIGYDSSSHATSQFFQMVIAVFWTYTYSIEILHISS